MSYKLTNDRFILKIEPSGTSAIPVTQAGGYIPRDPAGLFGQELVTWLNAGNVPTPADPPPAPAKPKPSEIEVLKQALVKKGVVAQKDLDDAAVEIDASSVAVPAAGAKI